MLILKALIILSLILIIVIYLSQSTTKWFASKTLRAPDSCFDNLTDYPFKANYIESLGYRMHYLDEGPQDGRVILLLHGQPSWSYLYRHMIPILSAAGYRVIAPDNVGFGKSDKPINQSAHNYQMHIDVMNQFIEQLELQNITLFAQDWGGLIGLRVVVKSPDRFARIMISNTTLPAASGIKGWLGFPLFKLLVWKEGHVETLNTDKNNFSFTQWVAYAQTTTSFDFNTLFQKATSRHLSDSELAGYTAPFPSNEYISGVRKFPTMIASQLRQNNNVMKTFYKNWNKPLLTTFGADDIIMKGRDEIWQNTVPGAKNQDHTLINGGAHFIQEDKPEELVERLIKFIDQNPLKQST